MVVGVICIGVMTIAMILFFIQDKKDKVKLKDQEARLEDEFIYDPETGRKITLEEAEKGHFIQPDVSARIKSDEEIEKNYIEDEKEIEYIKRYALKAQLPDFDNEELVEIIGESNFNSRFNSFDILHLWTLKSNLYIGLVQISNDYQSGRDIETIFEVQLILAGRRFSIANTQLFGDWEMQQKNDWDILLLPKKAKYKDFKTCVDRLDGNARQHKL